MTTYDATTGETWVWIKTRGKRNRELYGKWRPLFRFKGRA